MKPKIIAWSNGFTIIPFEHVLGVTEDATVDGQLSVRLTAETLKGAQGLIIGRENAQAFIDQYNNYLACVEGLQIQVKDGDIPLAQEEHQS